MEIEERPTLFGKILKNKILILATLGSTLLFAGIVLFLDIRIRKSDGFILTPLAKGIFTKGENQLFENILSSKTTDNYPPNRYFPQNLKPLHEDNIDIDSEAYGVMDRKGGKLLYGRNITHELPIASITKVMTAIVALESAPSDLSVPVSSYSASFGEATMNLTAGEEFTVEELLYGALLPSGNDAAEALAEGVGKHVKGLPQSAIDGGGARSWFIEKMNRKGQSLGLMDTYFFNPTGLDEETVESSSFSTALDLLALANYSLDNPMLAKIVATRYIQLPFIEGRHKAYYLENILQLEESFPGIKGIKPGTSIFAKETLMSYARRDGREIIVVILGSNHTKDDVLAIYERVFGE